MTGRCECSVGYGGDATTSTGCVACAKGLYKTTFGNIACTKCMDGATTLGTASNALALCQCADANGLLSDGKCLCKEGYSGNAAGGSCVKCASGTYKTAAGNTVCTACIAGAASALGSTSKTQCQCAMNSAPNAEAWRCIVFSVNVSTHTSFMLPSVFSKLYVYLNHLNDLPHPPKVHSISILPCHCYTSHP